MMNGREGKKDNDLFFTCSLVEYIARKTRNRPADIVDYLGITNLEKIYDLADIYHCDNIEDVSDEFIQKCEIPNGDFDNVSVCKYSVPTHWDIGKVYKRLILMIARDEKCGIVDALRKAYHSFVSDLIENYNGSFYYDNPQTIFQTYRNGEVFEE